MLMLQLCVDYRTVLRNIINIIIGGGERSEYSTPRIEVCFVMRWLTSWRRYDGLCSSLIYGRTPVQCGSYPTWLVVVTHYFTHCFPPFF